MYNLAEQLLFANLRSQWFAKTGGRKSAWTRSYGLFVAYGPTDAPELVVAAVVEQGSLVLLLLAGPIVYKCLKNGLEKRINASQAVK